MGNVGPWKRDPPDRQRDSDGAGRAIRLLPRRRTPRTCSVPGNAPTRVGIPTSAGFALTTANPLPATTNAVRFALGELVVGAEYFAEISLRVLALPLDPAFGNVNCAEVAGGDAASRAQDGATGGKDYLWRYFLPAPACVSLNLLFENTVDKVLSAANAPLVNTIEAKNLTTSPMTSVVVRDCYVPGEETLDPAGTSPGYTLTPAASGCPNPGNAVRRLVDRRHARAWREQVVHGEVRRQGSTSNQAVFTSNTFPAPGFVATAWTTVDNTAVMQLAMTATPTYVPALPGTVHYLASVKNAGTATATTTSETVQLPTELDVQGRNLKVNGVATALNPTQTGTALRFAPALLPASIAAGASLTFEFDVTVPVGTAPGSYTVDLQSWVKAGQDLEDSIYRVAPVAVLTALSDPPTVTSPILQGAATVAGKSTEAVGSTVTVYVNGNVAGAGTVGAGGAYAVAVASLFAGQRVEVTVKATTELESPKSPPEVVVGVSGTAACSDGKDNDGDGLIDSADPGCRMAAMPTRRTSRSARTARTTTATASSTIRTIQAAARTSTPPSPVTRRARMASTTTATARSISPRTRAAARRRTPTRATSPRARTVSTTTATGRPISRSTRGVRRRSTTTSSIPRSPTPGLRSMPAPVASMRAARTPAERGLPARSLRNLGGVPDDDGGSGCSCGVAPAGGSAHAVLAAAAMGVLLARRRRRR